MESAGLDALYRYARMATMVTRGQSITVVLQRSTKWCLYA